MHVGGLETEGPLQATELVLLLLGVRELIY